MTNPPTDAIEKLIEKYTDQLHGCQCEECQADANIARDQLERLKGEVATLNEAIALKVNNCQQERATLRAKLAELERERLYEGKAAVQWYNAYLLEYNGRWADDREHKDALAELRRRLSQNAYIAASKQVEIERLRALLKEAHDAMHSWHSSEYANHPLSIKVRQGTVTHPPKGRRMSREQWINEVYELLCKSQGAPENDTERKNLREWAESLADEETGYFQEGMTPLDAHNEEMSCA